MPTNLTQNDNGKERNSPNTSLTMHWMYLFTDEFLETPMFHMIKGATVPWSFTKEATRLGCH